MIETNVEVHGSDSTHGRRLEGVLLTGATGFLGSHLLRELLANAATSVTCLVRAPNSEVARARLLSTVERYFPELSDGQLDPRVHVVAGDVSEPRFGTHPGFYDELVGSIQVIVNSAASLGVGAPSEFRQVNVAAVAALLEFARRGRQKEVHHVSTVDVAGAVRGCEPAAPFTEAHLDRGQVLRGAYAETKFRAELLMRDAFRDGLNGAVYRIGDIAPHSETGRFQINIHQNRLARYVRACVRLGVVPYEPQTLVRPTPVDSVARAITTLMCRASVRDATYFVEAPKDVSQYGMVAALQAAGFAIRVLDARSFARTLRHLTNDEELLNVLLPDPGGEALQPTPLDARQSESTLSHCGFTYPDLSSDWFGRFIHHCIEVGFIEAPRHWNLGPVVSGLW